MSTYPANTFNTKLWKWYFITRKYTCLEQFWQNMVYLRRKWQPTPVSCLRCSVVDVSGGESKVWCCKEQYCIGTWNVMSMNQCKFDMVKQEMARVNINILGISELKCMGMGKFNSDDHCIYYCGQESLRRNAVALIVNKRDQNTVFGFSLKNDRMISVLSKANHSTS